MTVSSVKQVSTRISVRTVPVGKAKHPVAAREGKTCIDCHKGIAHKLPEDYDDDD